MDSVKPYIGPSIFILLLVASLLFFYTAYDKKSGQVSVAKAISVVTFSDFAVSVKEINKLAGLVGLALISITFVLGPLSKLFPKLFTKFLAWRKFLGLVGFAFVVLHSIISLVDWYKLDVTRMFFNNPKIIGLLAALGAFIIFVAMTITSTRNAMQKMGYKNWKLLQTTGYVALFLSIVHFIVLETRATTGFDPKPYAIVILALAIFAIILRIVLPISRAAERKSYEEHIGEKN